MQTGNMKACRGEQGEEKGLPGAWVELEFRPAGRVERTFLTTAAPPGTGSVLARLDVVEEPIEFPGATPAIDKRQAKIAKRDKQRQASEDAPPEKLAQASDVVPGQPPVSHPPSPDEVTLPPSTD
ncbi:hypothetical protein CaCOL14_011048 [Colletotrichum acutatum]